MNDVIKQGFIDCERFIDEHTPEELQEYEKSLNLDYESYYRTPEQVIEDLSSMQDVSSESIKESFRKVRYNDDSTEEVYNMHHDTAGNLHHAGDRSGEHTIKITSICPLWDENNPCKITCVAFKMQDTEEVEAAIRKWVEQHPYKDYGC